MRKDLNENLFEYILRIIIIISIILLFIILIKEGFPLP